MSTSPDRTHYRELVAQVAERARAILPAAVNGRLEKAVALVLMDEVLPQADGTVIVGSCSDPMQTYRLSGHTCECKDFTDGKAPQSWCKHRIAAGIHKRVGELLPQSTPVGTETPPPPLPEAPASVNLKVLMSGHEVMVTLRDQSEDALLGRLQALLKRTDIRPIPKPAPRSGSWKRSNQGR